ncbi:hypothetical protein OPU71_10180 [Niveibacterium sp. 24ML]|uniref:hypothetical protein n=1 Tax=Niveibacterium sp. 24ML TaxID=2985512 RepID=UPI00226DCF3B|nr:hypothetical protein [Niveibacterium sp. 24ML]MCX9156488.1 hypothetical protein [Niveibacterium sp. 24ML]
MSLRTEVAAERPYMKLPRLDLAMLSVIVLLAAVSFATADSRDEVKQTVIRIYWLSGSALPLFYVPQIMKFLRGKQGVGDFDVKADIAQFLLRLPAFLYAFVALNPAAVAPFAFAVGGDLVGRAGRLIAICIRLRRERKN